MSYTQVGTKTSLGEIAKIMGSDPTTVSRNVSFLVAIGVIDGGRDKGITPLGARLGRAIEFGQDEQSSKAWREALADVPLVQRLLSAIRVRGGMDGQTLQTQIVYTAGVSKSSGAMTGGAAVVEMLRAAHLIIERDGKYIAPSTAESSPSSDIEVQELPVEHTSVVERRVVLSDNSDNLQLRVDVRINVTATPEELQNIGASLRQLVQELRAAGVGEDESDDL
jgi:hypothetical protein